MDGERGRKMSVIYAIISLAAGLAKQKSQGVSFSGVGSGRKRKNTGLCLEELLRLCRAMLWEIKQLFITTRDTKTTNAL